MDDFPAPADILTLSPPPPGRVRLDDGHTFEPVPTYCETNTNPLLARMEELQSRSPGTLSLPISSYPSRPKRNRLTADNVSPELEAYKLAQDLVEGFHAAVRSKQGDVVAAFIEQGIVSPDVPDARGATPLLAAVATGSTSMVRHLCLLGAEVNNFGTDPAHSERADHYLPCAHRLDEVPRRTPLMLAASRGNLPLVKLLYAQLDADDAAVAPDGALALRLAAAEGHREIVDYLPARRGGAWLRWKAAHKKEMRRIRQAWDGIVTFVRFFVWDVPKFLLFTAPKGVAEWAWGTRHWWKRQVLAMPGRITKAAKKLWTGLKRVPALAKQASQRIVMGVKRIPKLLMTMARAVWHVIKAIPGVLKITGLWIWGGIKATGEAIWSVLAKTMSLLHTMLTAVVTFFRSITLRDVWNGFCNLLQSIFVTVPKAILNFIVKFREVSFKVLVGLFDGFGWVVWHIGAGIFWIIKFIPSRIAVIIAASSKLVSRGMDEFLIWLNPKRV